MDEWWLLDSGAGDAWADYGNSWSPPADVPTTPVDYGQWAGDDYATGGGAAWTTTPEASAPATAPDYTSDYTPDYGASYDDYATGGAWYTTPATTPGTGAGGTYSLSPSAVAEGAGTFNAPNITSTGNPYSFVDNTAVSANDTGVTGGFGTGGREGSLGLRASGERPASLLGDQSGNGPSLNMSAMAPAAASNNPYALTSTRMPSLAATGEPSTMDRVTNWVNKNAKTARLGLDALGMVASLDARRKAQNLAEEQMRFQREAQLKNAAMADTWNARADTAYNQAQSLYNPQEMAQRAMAQQNMLNANQLQNMKLQMMRAGKNKATIDAELRRAKVAGSTGSNLAYVKGLDTGRAALQGATSAAAGLSKPYNASADYRGASLVAQGGASDAAYLTSMVNNYLGNPVLQSQMENYNRAMGYI